MKIFDSKPFMDKGGWFIGDFEPTVFKTTSFEVSYKLHHKGEDWPKHYHKISEEINFLIRGKMTVNNTVIDVGTIFIIDRYESVKPIFLEDCELIVVKVPSSKNDKYEN